ncbi:hypothetical protein [Arsenicicoccus dermatophilus]|uniref:hypothetical protein n=1 Tax=Arsenicicoccus dermatophilus TaxID=1076331 RepID=UPI001F4C678B|nr:hypothetical protein [Arsenicicoccus dermatophilus]MCH8613458.1 hypothetical protein [Arsenicicoccus dermatophilus]
MSIATIRDALTRIHDDWDATADPPKTTGSSSRHAPGSLPPGAALTRADVHCTLTYWVSAYRHHHGPCDHGTGSTQGLARCLRDHLTRIRAWDDGAYWAAFTLDVIRAARTVQALTDPYPRQRIGTCHLTRTGKNPTDPGAVGEAICGGPVYATEPTPVPGRDTPPIIEATCDRCGSDGAITWWRRQWAPEPVELVSTDRLVKILTAQGIRTTASSIRTQLERGVICRSGTTKAGASLWDPTAVTAALALNQARKETTS